MKQLLKSFQIVLIAVLVGYITLSFSYMIPVKPMQEHMKQSIDSFINQDIYQEINSYGSNGMIDNFTDSLMISHAINESNSNPFVKSLENQRFSEADKDQRIVIKDYLNTGTSNQTINYNRYWHGYLTILKPALFLFEYTTLKTINLVVSIVLILLASILFYKKTNLTYALGFIGSILVLQPYIISQCLQYSSTYYISLISIILILLKYDKEKYLSDYIYLFVIIGCLTSFFDLLTAPLITFGLPLLTLISLDKNIKLKEVISIGLSWSLGYLGMWFGKWIITSLVLKTDIIKLAIETIAFRTSDTTSLEKISRIDTVITNYKVALVSNVVYINALFILVSFVYFKVNKYTFKLNKNIITILALSFVPVVWYLITSNHASIHYFYTFRSVSITVFAAYLFVFSNFNKG